MREPIVITLDSFMAALIDVVIEAGPGYVYPHDLCLYVRGGKPSCLIGKALVRLGVPINRLGGSNNVAGANSLLYWLANRDVVTVDPVVRVVASVAQGWQDSRETWGFCLDQAVIVAERRGWVEP